MLKEDFALGIVVTVLTLAVLLVVGAVANMAGQEAGKVKATRTFEQQAVAVGAGRYEKFDERVVFKWREE